MGLGFYDYGARFYDPTIRRWHAVDPLAHEYYSWAPYNYTLNNPVLYVDPNGEFVGTLIGGVVGGIAGGIKAAVKGENILAGIGEGATAGVIAGAIVDIAVASGGAGLVLIGAAATGGGLGAIARDMVGQGIVGFTEKGQSISEAVSFVNKDFSKTMDKALKGMAAGAVGGVAGFAVGKAMESAKASTKVILESMSKNIDETATTLRTMGANTSTTQQAVNKITEGMGAAGRNTANNVVKTESAVSGTVEVVNQTLGGGSVNEKKITYPTGILGQE